MLRVFVFFTALFLLISCGSENSYNPKAKDIDPTKYISLSPQETIQNPLSLITPQELENFPKDVDIIGKSVETDISLEDFKCIPEGNLYVCIYGFNFLNGKGGRIHFKNVNLPENTKLYVFNNQYKEIYTSSDRTSFWSVNFDTSNVYVAFVYPRYISFERSPFVIDMVSYIWDKSVYLNGIETQYARPTECETVDVKCMTDTFEEDKWKYAKSTSMIIISDRGFTYQCSGNLIKSKNDNDDPILITARHCFRDNDELLEDAVFWFEYYSRECESFYGDKNKHYTTGGRVLAKYKNDIALVEVKGSLKSDKYTYQWLNWAQNKECIDNNTVGFSYPKENYLRYHEGFKNRGCYIESSSKGLKAVCRYTYHPNGFEVIWDTGSVDKGSSGSALLEYCKLDNDGDTDNDTYDWIITGILSAKNRGCNPANGIYGDFFYFINESEEGLDILMNGLPDDEYEENDSFEKAFNTDVFLGEICGGVEKLENLALKDNDDDWFSVSLQKGCKFILEADFIRKHGDIGLEIFDENKNLIYTSPEENQENKETYELLARENKKLYIRLHLKDDTYQNYDLLLIKKKEIRAPRLEVDTDLGDPILRYRGIEKIYYTNKNVVNLYIKMESDFYDESDIKMCISRYLNFCRKWSSFKGRYVWHLGDEEGKYYKFVSLRTPTRRYSNFKKITVYYDTTPPTDGNISYVKRSDGIEFLWDGFSDNLSGIQLYKIVYGKKNSISCKTGDTLYVGSENKFLYTSPKTGYYLLCARDKAGNWSTGKRVFIKY
jgi:hypothetical protein